MIDNGDRIYSTLGKHSLWLLTFSDPFLPYCGDVTGSYESLDGVHDLVLVQDDENDVIGFYRNSSTPVYVGLTGDLGHPDYASRILVLTSVSHESVLSLAGLYC